MTAAIQTLYPAATSRARGSHRANSSTARPRYRGHMTQPAEPGRLSVGALEVQLGRRTALAAGRRLDLTPREFDLLAVLAAHAGEPVARRELYERVWRLSYRPSERSVDVYVSRLRRKLAAALPEQQLIHTHVRYGYRLTPAAGPGQDDDGPAGPRRRSHEFFTDPSREGHGPPRVDGDSSRPGCL